MWEEARGPPAANGKRKRESASAVLPPHAPPAQATGEPKKKKKKRPVKSRKPTSSSSVQQPPVLLFEAGFPPEQAWPRELLAKVFNPAGGINGFEMAVCSTLEHFTSMSALLLEALKVYSWERVRALRRLEVA